MAALVKRIVDTRKETATPHHEHFPVVYRWASESSTVARSVRPTTRGSSMALMFPSVSMAQRALGAYDREMIYGKCGKMTSLTIIDSMCPTRPQLYHSMWQPDRGSVGDADPLGGAVVAQRLVQ